MRSGKVKPRSLWETWAEAATILAFFDKFEPARNVTIPPEDALETFPR